MVLFQTLRCSSGSGKAGSSVGSQTRLSTKPQTLLRSGKEAGVECLLDHH